MLNEVLSRMPQVFEAGVLARGRQYHAEGRVLAVRQSEGLVKARVRGSGSHLYDVYLDLRTWPKTPAHCTCPQSVDCKHVVAALLALGEKYRANEPRSLADDAYSPLEHWIREVSEAPSAQAGEPVSQALIYILSPARSHAADRVYIRLASAKRLKKGGFGKPAVFHSLTPARQKALDDGDVEIVLPLLYRNEALSWFDALECTDSHTLARILETGRALWQTREYGDIFPLRQGEPLAGVFEWRLGETGLQTLKLMHGETPVAFLALDSVWYLDAQTGVWGAVHTPYSHQQTLHLLEAPPVPLEQAAQMARDMAQHAPDLPAPRIFEHREQETVRPLAVAVFDALPVSASHPFLGRSDAMDNPEYDDIPHRLVVTPVFDYAGMVVPFNAPGKSRVIVREGVLVECLRDMDFERNALHTLTTMLSLRAPAPREFAEAVSTDDPRRVLGIYQSPEGIALLSRTIVPQLRVMGWRVELMHPLLGETLDADAVEWYSGLEESDHGWFGYELGILVDGERISLVPVVARMIRTTDLQTLDAMDETTPVHLDIGQGKRLAVPISRIRPLIRLLMQIGFRDSGQDNVLRLTRYQILLAEETERALQCSRARWHGAERIRAGLKRLSERREMVHIAPPGGLKTTLRDYQQEGLNWLQTLREAHFGGILADDMGLGKTVQTLAHLLYEKEQGRLDKPCLIVAPASLMSNWYEEAERFAPALRCRVYHGSGRERDAFAGWDLIISTYALVQRDKAQFLDCDYYYLILDEAQGIKNARTKTTQVVNQLRAQHRLCLTGTPLENHLGELWSLFHFLMPGLLGDAKTFRSFFRIPVEKEHDMARRAMLVGRLQPFMLRRTKNEVARELPPKTEITHHITLEGSQRDLYEGIRMSMEKKVRDAIASRGMEKSHIILLDALLKLRQACCDPRLVRTENMDTVNMPSGKLEALMELLDNLLEEGRRVLVFSQFTSMLSLIEEQLNARQYPYLTLTGQSRNRGELVTRFQEGNIPVFLISLKAGGTGLNLTRADTVIHYDPWWNPAVEAQATDRTHRIGQDNPVFVYRLVATGTVEDAILRMQSRKRALYEGVLSATGQGARLLTDDDIAAFFAPIGQASE